MRMPLMRGSDLEILAWPDRLEGIINQPQQVGFS